MVSKIGYLIRTFKAEISSIMKIVNQYLFEFLLPIFVCFFNGSA
ncbi:hypothetical protein SAMN05443252_107197 [Bacillus sp. OV322]|nr:hypothetical protein SAMN05443252_107197 [Bacillus sp. OV322]